MINSFKTVAKKALLDSATRLQGAMVARHPVKKTWDYFLGGTPAHDIVNGEVVKWDTLAEGDYPQVFVSQQQAEMVQSGEDEDGNKIDLEIELDMLESATVGW